MAPVWISFVIEFATDVRDEPTIVLPSRLLLERFESEYHSGELAENAVAALLFCLTHP